MVKLTLRDKESAQEAVRRFRKLVERSGIKKEMRVREFYENPAKSNAARASEQSAHASRSLHGDPLTRALCTRDACTRNSRQPPALPGVL